MNDKYIRLYHAGNRSELQLIIDEPLTKSFRRKYKRHMLNDRYIIWSGKPPIEYVYDLSSRESSWQSKLF